MREEIGVPSWCAVSMLNYFCTPEGFMTMTYGPKDECWYYDEEGNTHFTELGKACNADIKTKMEKHNGSFQDGQMQMAVSSWATDAKNPDSNGETYNCLSWKSEKATDLTPMEADWCKVTGAEGLNDYFEGKKYTLAPSTSYTPTAKSDELKVVWKQVTDTVKNESWNAIYADSDKEFDACVKKMREKAKEYGYDQCIEWCRKEAEVRKSLEDEIMN